MEKTVAIALLMFLVFVGSEASHFRGGTASWKHLSSKGNVHELEFSFRLGWRRDSNSIPCDYPTIEQETPGYDNGQWVLSGSASSATFPHSTATICTSFEPDENWAYGFNSFQANITTTSEFTIAFTGNAWIDGLYFGGGRWSVALNDINLGIRSDTGKTNNPPTTLSAPVVRLQLGCKSKIVIPVIDEDGDRVTCRFANSDSECAGICGNFSHFKLIKETCTIEYDGGGGEYLVPVALMIEDHSSYTINVGGDTKTTSDSLSSIPLQFLVDLKPTNSCNVRPSFPPDTIQNNSTLPVQENGSFNKTLDVFPSRPGIAIVYFVVIGPVGMRSSGVIHYGGDLYGTILSWIPTDDQVGSFTVCFYAVDDDGINSEQRCFTITISDTHPCDRFDKGGCSDICVKNGSSYSCSCQQTCWNLYDDGKTCIPSAKVTCDGEIIDVEFPKCVSDKPIFAGTSFNRNTECQSKENNFTHHLYFDNDQCGVSVTSSAAGIHYKTDLHIYNGVNFGIITRGEWVKIPLTCTLPASSNITGSFLPEVPMNGDNALEIEGMGTFTFYFDFYRESSFSSVYSPFDYPIEVSLKQNMYFILGAIGSGDLEFFTEICVATSDRNLSPTTLSYPFIENGCLVDPTLRVHTPASQMENRFSIQAFQFADKLLSNSTNAEVFIQCSVRLCVKNSSTRCSRGCVSSVSKRSVSHAENSIFRFERDIVDKMDDDEYDVPEMEIDESPLEDIFNSYTLRLDEGGVVEDGGVDDDNKEDDGNDGTRPVVMIWMILLTATISIFTH